MNKTVTPGYLHGELRVLPSKSASHRAVMMAALARGKTLLEPMQLSKDIGATLTINGFMSVFGTKIPGIVVAICLTLFAFTTCLTWALYGSRCFEYLLGTKARKPYQILYCAVIILGSVTELELAWNIADTLNGLMAIPNLIGLLLLSPVVVKLSREYFADVKRLKDPTK